MTKRFLTRDLILAADDLKTEEVEVPEWGGVVLVREMTGMERDQYERRMVQAKGNEPGINLDGLVNIRAWVAAACMVDGSGKRLFTERDVMSLGRKSAAALGRVYDVATRLSGLMRGDLDELEKNSENIPNGGSISD